MKLQYSNFALISIMFLSIVTNFNSFLMGGAPSLLGIIITFVYISFWFLFIFLSKNRRKTLIFSIRYWLLTLTGAFGTLVVNINNEINLDFIIPIAIIFLTPLNGIVAFFDQSRFIMASIIIIIISLAWIIVSIIFLKRMEHPNKS